MKRPRSLPTEYKIVCEREGQQISWAQDKTAPMLLLSRQLLEAKYQESQSDRAVSNAATDMG